ncbi:hypothetical protein ASG87_06820 [Frateuria sp. Soil773]|uniref:DUF2894 domain-containing protein n=1 Tax=Frateuria sp. Soil773 TaxID=1736407 RepID=UPI0006FCEDCF|nr:DUF2894 domain-containing protein [Frateuria sp. Soil773]KRE88324.1 hypothetical protein ASG87_06820 [Frateuria sp. Soil773]
MSRRTGRREASHGLCARARLDAWRGQGADRLDPVRFHFIDALERRAAGHDGAARKLLDARLAGLLETYAADLERTGAVDGRARGEAAPGVPARGALGDLVDYIARQAARDGTRAEAGPTLRRASPTGPEALGELRKTWSELRTGSQLRKSLEQVPANAGPLNSGSLVHRSLTLMRELSPGYLQQFMAYVDALSWMEQVGGNAPAAVHDGGQPASARKRTRSRPRAPRS